MKSQSILAIVSCSALLFGAGCMNALTTQPASTPQAASGTSTTFAVPVKTQVMIQNQVFVPTSTTIQVGTIVEWTNQDSALHSITADDMAFDSEPLATGMKYSFTFTKPGTYAYHCKVYPEIKGTIVVQ
jgi:plastocyanin